MSHKPDLTSTSCVSRTRKTGSGASSRTIWRMPAPATPTRPFKLVARSLESPVAKALAAIARERGNAFRIVGRRWLRPTPTELADRGLPAGLDFYTEHQLRPRRAPARCATSNWCSARRRAGSAIACAAIRPSAMPTSASPPTAPRPPAGPASRSPACRRHREPVALPSRPGRARHAPAEDGRCARVRSAERRRRDGRLTPR